MDFSMISSTLLWRLSHQRLEPSKTIWLCDVMDYSFTWVIVLHLCFQFYEWLDIYRQRNKMRSKAWSKKKVSQEHGPVVYKKNLFLIYKNFVKNNYFERSIFFSDFWFFNYRNPGIWATVFSSGFWLCCALLTFILNLSTWVFHFFGKAAGGIFEHLPISHGITPHLLRELAPLIWACPFIHCAGTWFKPSIYQNLHHWTFLLCTFY